MPDSDTVQHFVLNGELQSVSEAKISLYSRSLFSSFGVYESIAIERGCPFYIRDHLERLFHSAAIIDLSIGYSLEMIEGWIYALMAQDSITESLLRVIVFGPNTNEHALVYILPSPLPRYPDEYYLEGATAISYVGSRPLPQAKTLNTLVNYLSLRQARKAGAHEALLVNSSGYLTEGSRSNLFAVMQEKLITPPADEVVSGITRQLICRLAVRMGLPVSEAHIPMSNLTLLDEAFVTSTSMHVIPIVRINEQAVGQGRVGTITRRLVDEFQRHYYDTLTSSSIVL